MNIKTLRQVCKSYKVCPPLPADEAQAEKEAIKLIAAMQYIASYARR